MQSVNNVKLLIADDHAAFSERLASMLRDIKGIEIVGQAESVVGAIDSIQKAKPDVVIVDIHMPPGAGGFELLRRIKGHPRAPIVIILTAFPSDAYRQKSTDMGAEYFFDKSKDLRRMVMVIKELSVKATERPSSGRATNAKQRR